MQPLEDVHAQFTQYMLTRPRHTVEGRSTEQRPKHKQRNYDQDQPHQAGNSIRDCHRRNGGGNKSTEMVEARYDPSRTALRGRLRDDPAACRRVGSLGPRKGGHRAAELTGAQGHQETVCSLSGQLRCGDLRPGCHHHKEDRQDESQPEAPKILTETTKSVPQAARLQRLLVH